MTEEAIESCPICNGRQFQKEFISKDETVSGEFFPIIRCSICTLMITSPRPDQNSIGKYYQSNSYISHANKSATLIDKIYFEARKIALRQKRRLIEKYSSNRTLLDVGCGTGAFINYMTQHSWETTGVEPSEKARLVSESLNKNVKADLDHLAGKTFSIITLWHVLEHIHSLNENLNKITTLLDLSGTIFIAVPNHKSFDAKYYQSKWAAYDPPRHLWHFNQKSMTMLLQNHKLKLEATIPMKMDSYYVALLSEKYGNPRTSSIVQILKAITLGLISNIKAKSTTEYSSLIYVVKKQ